MKGETSALGLFAAAVIAIFVIGFIILGPLRTSSDQLDRLSNINLCTQGGLEGRCFQSVASCTPSSGWKELALDGICLSEETPVCCYCEDENVCFGGKIYLDFNGFELEFFERNENSYSDLRFPGGQPVKGETFNTSQGFSKTRLFNFKYWPETGDETCTLTLRGGGHSKTFTADCVPGEFVFLNGLTPLKHVDLEDDAGNHLCTSTGNVCQLDVDFSVNNGATETYTLYFEE